MKLKTQMVTKLKKLKLWQNSKTQIVTKLKNSNCDKTQIVKKNSNCENTQIMTQLKNSKCDKTQTMTMLNNSNCVKTKKTQILEKNSNCNKTQTVIKLKLWQISKSQIVTQLKNSNCDNTQKTQIVTNLKCDKSQFMKKKTTLKGSFSKNNLTPWRSMRCTLCSLLQSRNVFVMVKWKYELCCTWAESKSNFSFYQLLTTLWFLTNQGLAHC